VEPCKGGLRETESPNELWCMDYKGQFRLGNREYCYPFTVTDHFSRFLIGCEALESTRSVDTQTVLLSFFGEYGLPDAIRSDNGTPFASQGRLGLSRIGVQLLRLGVAIERIEPGKPQQNGRHERMHRTLKADATRPAAPCQLRQQEKFNKFRHTFNEERPHEALDMKTPASVYAASTRSLPQVIPAPEYPLHDLTVGVSNRGTFWMRGLGYISIGAAFSEETLGLRQVEEGTWLVSFMNLDVGYLDSHTKKIIDLPRTEGLQM
jgi:hypothetical protein